VDVERLVMPRVLRASEKVQTTIVKGGKLSMSFQLKALDELFAKSFNEKSSQILLRSKASQH
jgi:hypothetical protein